MKASKILDLAEALNNVQKEYGVDLKIVEVKIDNKEALSSLCRLQDSHLFEPDVTFPYYWAHIKFGDIEISVKTDNVKFEFKIVE